MKLLDYIILAGIILWSVHSIFRGKKCGCGGGCSGDCSKCGGCHNMRK